jgi:hypothetical protein
MSDFKILKCPSCGASLVETLSESILICSHCGTKLVHNNIKDSKDMNFKQLNSDSSLIKKLLLLVISLMLLLAGGLFWYSNKTIEQKLTEKSKIALNNGTTTGNTNKLINTPLSSIPTLNTQAMGVNKQSIAKNKDKVDMPSISIVSQVAGETVIGG